MLKNERQKQILKLIEQKNSLRVDDLANYFNVSRMTIRRDLSQLEKTDYLKRTRGGATARKLVYSEKDFSERKVEHLSEKRRIAEVAIQFMEPNDSLLLDYGSTPQELAKLMINRIDFPLTIVINDFNLYRILRKNSSFNLIFVGGTVEQDGDHITSGYLAHQFYQQLTIDKAFMSMRTINFSKGLFHPNSQIAETKRCMIEAAKKVIVIADHSKFNNHSLFNIAPIEKVNILITDTGFNDYDIEIPKHLSFIKA